MKNFVDRRLNPKDKSLGNRRKFLRRVRGQVKASVDEAVRNRKIADVDRGDKVGVPADGIREPRFRYEPGSGRVQRVLPGNKQFGVGDRIRKPQGGGGGGRGRKGSDQGEGEDEFAFVLSREEFLDLFFEPFELFHRTTIRSPRPRARAMIQRFTSFSHGRAPGFHGGGRWNGRSTCTQSPAEASAFATLVRPSIVSATTMR